MKNPVAVIRGMLGQLGLTQYLFSLLRGVDERTVNAHLNGGVIPVTAKDYLNRVALVRTYPGGAVIYLDMPMQTPTGEYRREAVKDDETPAGSNTPTRRKSLS
jgi:hypothetical protein